MFADETSPTARALLALELIQTRPGITADQLGDRLGVSSRAARRYVAILREAGMPVTSVSGPAGGYRLGRGVRLPPLVFSSAEALGLVMAVLDGHHAASDPEDPVGRALAKILRSMPENIAAQAETVRQGAAPAPDYGAARPEAAITAELVQACVDRRVLTLDYRSERGNELTIQVEPWAVVVRYGRWYLLCRRLGSGEVADDVRAYRVDRVRRVQHTQRSFEPPADLDPVVALEEHLASGWSYPCEIVIDAPIEQVSRCIRRTTGRLEAIDENHCRLVGSTSNTQSYAEQLALIPAPFRVVNGDEVREAVRRLGERMTSAAAVECG